jgi:hypothetical protein
MLVVMVVPEPHHQFQELQSYMQPEEAAQVLMHQLILVVQVVQELVEMDHLVHQQFLLLD